MNPESQYTLHSTLRIIVIFFVPLFPALFAMTRLPKGKSEASGPFSGLRIKLTGGGAFYFILLLIAWALYPAPKLTAAVANAWVVKGTIELVPATPGAEPPEAVKVATLQCKPMWHDKGAGNFVITVAVPDLNGDALWPSLTFTADKYKSITIPTEDPRLVEINEAKHIIRIKDKIILNLLPIPANGSKEVVAKEVVLPNP